MILSVRPRDRVKSFDRLCEVQSDKATVEITSRYDGVVREVYHAEGAVVKVGAVLVDIERPPAHMITPKLNNLETHYEIPPELTDGFLDLDLLNMKEEQYGKRNGNMDVTNSHGSENLHDMSDFLQWQKELDMQPIEQQQKRNGHALSSSSSSSSHANDRTNDMVLATPAVRGLAKEMNVVLADVSANGARVTEEDVLKYVANRQVPPTEVVPKSTTTTTTDWRWRELENVQQNGTSRGLDNRSPAQRRRTSAAVHTSPSSSQVNHQQQQPPLPSSSSNKIVVPIRGIQRAMAKTMTAALNVPSLTYSDDVECDAMLRLRKRLNASMNANLNNSSSVEQQQAVTKISSMPIIIKALSLALALHPTINSTMECPDCSQVVLHAHHNIGVAMDTKQGKRYLDHSSSTRSHLSLRLILFFPCFHCCCCCCCCCCVLGLLVPVLKNVQSKSVVDIAGELMSLQQAAASGRGLSEDQLSGGTFTISNIGSIGGTTVTPVVLVPQVAIMALGKMRVVPRYSQQQAEQVMRRHNEDDLASALQPTPVTVMGLSISADHRVLDGAAVARFSNTFKRFLEDPSSMLAQLR